MSSHNYSLFTEKGYQLTKRYTVPKTYLGMGRYAAYKNFGESVWRIGYGSESIDDHYLDSNDKASQDDIDKQFYKDLKFFSKEDLASVSGTLSCGLFGPEIVGTTVDISSFTISVNSIFSLAHSPCSLA